MRGPMGVDRWFGQPMRPSQLQSILRYHRHCRRGECPPWVYGLLIMIGGKECLGRRRQWDYGLCMDLTMLCAHRESAAPVNTSGGRFEAAPFSFMPMFWSVLTSRRLECDDHAMLVRGQQQ